MAWSWVVTPVRPCVALWAPGLARWQTDSYWIGATGTAWAQCRPVAGTGLRRHRAADDRAPSDAGRTDRAAGRGGRRQPGDGGSWSHGEPREPRLERGGTGGARSPCACATTTPQGRPRRRGRRPPRIRIRRSAVALAGASPSRTGKEALTWPVGRNTQDVTALVWIGPSSGQQRGRMSPRGRGVAGRDGVVPAFPPEGRDGSRPAPWRR